MTRDRGFTLVELSVALIIIALLLAGALIPLSTQMEVRNTADTQRSLDGVREAIIGFALANGRLPCPADGSVADGVAGAGTEQYNGASCTATVGVIPWTTLGVPETDAWGRRFTYRVASVFADAVAASSWATATTNTPASAGNQPACAPTPTPTLSSFALCSLGDIAVMTRTESATAATVLGIALPAVIVSHGKNGYSAWQSNGTRLTPAPVGGDEVANASGTTAATGVTLQALGGGTNAFASWIFYHRNQAPVSSGCSDPAPGAGPSGSPICEFDDIVATISSNTLIARMVAAGRLP